MAINKIMDKIGNVLLDLTGDTIEPSKVLEGYSFHDKTGAVKVGTLPAASGEIDYTTETIFYDYDGTIVAHMPWQQAQQLSEMPTAPDHTDENLTFDGWNYTLAEMQEFNGPLDIGAHYKTTDGATYIYLDVVETTYGKTTIRYYNGSNSTTEIYIDDTLIRTDTTSGSKSQSYNFNTTGQHVLKFVSTGTYYFQQSVIASVDFAIKNVVGVKLSDKCTSAGSIFIASNNYYAVPCLKINVPSTTTFNPTGGWKYLTYVTIPKNMDFTYFLYGYNLKNISIGYNTNILGYTSNTIFQSNVLNRLIIPRFQITNSSRSIWNTESAPKYFRIYSFNCAHTTTTNVYIPIVTCYRYIDMNTYMVNAAAYLRDNNYQNIILQESICKDDTGSNGVYNIPNGATDTSANVVYLFEKIVAPSSLNKISITPTSGGQRAQTVDLTNCERVVTLNSVISLSNLYYRLVVLVPQTLYTQYEVATNWSVLCAAGIVKGVNV